MTIAEGYSELTGADLRRACRERGVKVPSRHMTGAVISAAAFLYGIAAVPTLLGAGSMDGVLVRTEDAAQLLTHSVDLVRMRAERRQERRSEARDEYGRRVVSSYHDGEHLVTHYSDGSVHLEG